MHVKNFWWMLPVMYSLYGCSSTYQIDSEAEAHRQLEGKSGTIFLADSASFNAEDMHVAADSVSFTESQTDTLRTVALRDIASVKKINRAAGLAEGTLFGVIGGFALSTLLAEINAEEPGHEANATVGFMRRITITGGTLIGTAVGVMAGTAIGHRESFVFSSPEGQDRMLRPVAPEPSAPPGRESPGSVLRSIAEMPEDPLSVRIGLRGGLDFRNSVADSRGTLRGAPGYMVGFMSRIDLFRMYHATWGLGVELNYSKIRTFSPDALYGYAFPAYQDRYVAYRLHRLTFVDLGALPEVFIPIKGGLAACIYLGGSLGVGIEGWKMNLRSYSRVPSSGSEGSPVFAGRFWDGESAPDSFRAALCGIAGVSLYYKVFMIDLRFRNTKAINGYAYENFYVGAGLVI